MSGRRREGRCESTANGYVSMRGLVCEEARDKESSARKLLQSTNKSSQEEARRLDFHVMTCLVFMQCNVNESMLLEVHKQQ